jgi:hypothetical protein
MMLRVLGVGAAVLALGGCGYIGEPMPPLLNIPARIADLAAAQRGDRIIVQFSVPRLTTEAVALRAAPRLELLAGEGAAPFQMDAWVASAKPAGGGVVTNFHARYEIPVDGWSGKEILFAARAIGPRGRAGMWSNLVTVGVVPAPPKPAGLRPEAVPEGVLLTWQANAAPFRLYRRGEGEKSFQAVADTAKPAWTDTTTEYGKTYYYQVESVVKTATGGEAQSELSEEVRITPVDIFPPAVPAGLTGVASIASIELAWERDTEPDLAGYRVYRSAPGGAFTKLADTGVTPSYSDRGVEHGKAYRYAVTAVDAHGNESKMSAPVEVTVQ